MAASDRLGLSLRGILRFVVLLAAACLVGALVGLLTEPLEHDGKTKKLEASAREPIVPAATPPSTDEKKADGRVAEDWSEAAASTKPNTGSPSTGDSSTLADGSGAATAETSSATGPLGAVGSLAPDFTGLYVASGALLLFIFLAMSFAKKSKATRAGNGTIHLVDTLHLGGGRRVHLLRCDGRKYLIANSERGVSFLASLPQNEVERAFDAEVAATPREGEDDPGEAVFDRVLGQSLTGSVRR